jgi:hypothetical protein
VIPARDERIERRRDADTACNYRRLLFIKEG